MKNLIPAVILLVMFIASLGGLALTVQATKRAEARAEAAEAATVRLERELNAWDIAAKRCQDAIGEAREQEKAK